MRKNASFIIVIFMGHGSLFFWGGGCLDECSYSLKMFFFAHEYSANKVCSFEKKENY